MNLIGSIYFIVIGLGIGALTIFKPNFFWNHHKAKFVRKYLGDFGTVILYLVFSFISLAYGLYSLNEGL